jgi:hypothetical protein
VETFFCKLRSRGLYGKRLLLLVARIVLVFCQRAVILCEGGAKFYRPIEYLTRTIPKKLEFLYIHNLM